MEPAESLPPAFPARIGRRLSLVLAAVVLSVLLIGGLSVLLARGIQRGYEAVVRENQHFMLLTEIQGMFLRLHARIERLGERRGRPQDLAELRPLHADLGRWLQRFDDLHREAGGRTEVERLREDQTFDALKGLHRQLGAMITDVTAAPARAWSHAALDRISGQANQALVGLTRGHHEAVARQADAGRMNLQFLIGAYVACLLAAGWLVIAGSLALRRRLITPLNRVAATAATVAEGRLDVRVPVDSKDEIGQLSHVFNVMVERLQAHEREIGSAQRELAHRVREAQTLYRIGTEVAALRELEPILRLVADSARELLHADAATVCLRAKGGNDGILQAASGPPDAFPTPRSRVCEACLSDAGFSGLSAQCPLLASRYFESRLPVPICRQDAVIGVLCVGAASPRTFTGAEAELLAALATQTGIAVEKAGLHDEIRGLAATQERERIAREMHDGLAQTVGLLHLKLKQMRLLADMGRPDEDLLPEVIGIAGQAYDEVRQSIFGLRIAPGSDVVATMKSYLREFSSQSGIRVDLEAPEKPLSLSPLAEVQVIRILQEALANVRKHAKANRARVRVCRQQTAVELSMEDDGCGVDLAALDAGQHFGLKTMRERAESLGGTFSVESTPGKGTRVVATIPEGR